MPIVDQPYEATALPSRPMVPIGARRMIHHSSFWMIASTERENVRNGAAFSPTLSAATPTTIAITRICSTLNVGEEASAPSSPAVVLTVRPRKFAGTREVRKSSQPTSLAWYDAGAVWPVPTPGCSTTPTARPMSTAMRLVMANHSRVLAARRAALVTWARLAMEATTAKKTSGTTVAFSRLM